jgi:hypothetical protein
VDLAKLPQILCKIFVNSLKVMSRFEKSGRQKVGTASARITRLRIGIADVLLQLMLMSMGAMSQKVSFREQARRKRRFMSLLPGLSTQFVGSAERRESR